MHLQKKLLVQVQGQLSLRGMMLLHVLGVFCFKKAFEKNSHCRVGHVHSCCDEHIYVKFHDQLLIKWKTTPNVIIHALLS